MKLYQKALTPGRTLAFFPVVAGLLLLCTAAFCQEPPPFEMLVVGDSHISGQGLREQNKFYFLVKEWLQRDVFSSSRKVNLNVKAHAGSRIELHPDEIEIMKKTGDDTNKFYEREANLSSPSIRAQIDFARKEYASADSVDLVMLSGCITDVLVANTINPFYKEKKLKWRIHRFCNESMAGLLEHTTAAFPNATVVVVGYFPIVSTKSDMNKISRYFLSIVDLPKNLEFVFTNPVSKQLLKILRRKIARRSTVWLTESNREIREAVEKVNAALAQPRVLFVESPITDDGAYATKNPMLWEIGKKSLPVDETLNERLSVCSKVFSEIKYQHYGRLSTRMCELSSIAHPNVEGAKAYADAVKNALKGDISNRSAAWNGR